MDIFLTIIRWCFIIGAPLYLLNKYALILYKFSLWQHLIWIFTPSGRNSIDLLGPFMTVVLFILGTCFIKILTDRVLVSAFGTKQEYIYLGNQGEYVGKFYKQFDLSNEEYATDTPHIAYNYTFKNINRKQLFISNPSITSGLGETAGQFSLGATLAPFFTALLFFIPMLGTLHSSYTPMCYPLFPHDDNNPFIGEFAYSYNEILNLHGFTFPKVIIGYGLTFILMIFLMIKFPPQKFGERITPIPNTITIGETLIGTPLEIKMLYAQERYEEFGEVKYREVATTRRNVTFVFKNLYEKNVYVTAMVETNKQPLIENSNTTQLEKDIADNIEKETEMKVTVNEGLGIDLVNQTD